MLSPKQRTLIKRIESPLDEERSWVSSIGQALIGKQIKNFDDQDEHLLYQAMHVQFKELDALVSLSEEGVDRRLNVALTRARKHLIILGNGEVLKMNPIYGKLIGSVS